MAEDGLSWRTLSKELEAVVRTHGPLPLGDVAGIYQAVHSKPFKLGGHKLRDCLRQEGQLQGALHINWKTGMLETKRKRRAAAPKVTSAALTIKGAIAASTIQTKPGTAWQAATPPTMPLPDEPLVAYHLIDSVQSCTVALIAISPEYEGGAVSLSLRRICRGRAIAVELDGSGLGTEEGKLSLVKIAGGWSGPQAVIFDVSVLERTTIGSTLLREQLCPMFEDESSTKVVHDFNNAAVALRRHFGAALTIGRLVDTQLASEVLLGDVHADLDSVLKAFAGDHDSADDGPHRALASRDITADATRPISARALARAARSVTSLVEAGKTIGATGLNEEQKNHVLKASKLKIDNAMSTLDGTRRMTFRDQGTCSGGGVGRAMASFELKETEYNKVPCIGSKSMEEPDCSGPLLVDGRIGSFLGRTRQIGVVSDENAATEDGNSPHEVLRRIPEDFLVEHLRDPKNLQDLVDIVLDEGRRPTALLHGPRIINLCSEPSILVTEHDIDQVVGELERGGKFGDDNRAGFPGQLHRVSVLRRKKESKIIGVTLRIGRFFKGSAGLIDDLLFPAECSPGKPRRAPSILVLGVPGSGKTTAIRDICRKLSAEQSVMIVDTSNEIAGDGDTPHLAAIGQSRRIMVPNKKEQHRVMTEALQNHTPQTIVVDEISDDKEACACLDIKERGVRVVASAHGDFRSLLKSPKLNTLVGGKTSVTVGDSVAKANGGSKVQTQRAGAPIFDTIIELKRGDVNEWSIIRDVGASVDALLNGHSYKVERRTRLKQDSQIEHNKGCNCEDVTFRLAYEKERKKAL